MNTPRVLPPPRRVPPTRNGETTEVVTRLKRIESRVVQLMKHVGMTTDGRAALPEDIPLPSDSQEN